MSARLGPGMGPGLMATSKRETYGPGPGLGPGHMGQGIWYMTDSDYGKAS